VLDINRDGGAQAGDLVLEGVDGPTQQRLEQHIVQVLLPVAQPTRTGDGALDINAIGLCQGGHRMEADLQHEERMIDEKGAQVRDVLLVLTELDQQRLDIGGRRVGRGARAGTGGERHGQHEPIQQSEQRAVALHDWIVQTQTGEGVLIQDVRRGYHDPRLLGVVSEWYL